MNAQTISEKNEIFKTVLLNSTLFTDLNFSHDGNFPSTTIELYSLEFNNSNNRVLRIQLNQGRVFRIIILRDATEDSGLIMKEDMNNFFLVIG